MKKPRLLIEDWLPAAAIGVECMRERGSASALAPTTYLHVWWARRPLVAARAAVLGSLLPADFSHEAYERLLGFGRPGSELVKIRQLMDTGKRIDGGFNCDRAFKRPIPAADLENAHAAAKRIFGNDISVIDPMAGGGSIPLESARLGFQTLANEYNPVACTVLEATVDYPFRYGTLLAERTRYWGAKWISLIAKQLSKFFPKRNDGAVQAYIYARTVPCPDTGYDTPLVSDWYLLKPKGSLARIWAEPVVDKKAGAWKVRIIDSRLQQNKGKSPPPPTYGDGKGISLFSGQQIPDDWIKAKAQAGEMRSALYAIAVKTPQGLKFEPPSDIDLLAIERAQHALEHRRSGWEDANIIPTEEIPEGDKTREALVKGILRWADMFTPRQLLAMGVLVEELQAMRAVILKSEGVALGEAVIHLLSFAVDKFLNHNCSQTRWENTRAVIKSKMDRHDYAFKTTFGELAPCSAGGGLNWTIENVCDAYEAISKLPKADSSGAVSITLGSATSMPGIPDKSISAVVVDPPYADNVQYSELADFFYVWLKRTQGHRRPEWFSSYLCDHTEEAVVNIARYREGVKKVADARREANAFYQNLMRDTFKECRRILDDNGALTVMFTHKKQEAWQALFTSLIQAGFTITATWPVKTESEHSLHQAKKNAAQSTVILVARKRDEGSDVGYYDSAMQAEIRLAARKTAERLMKEGLNPVDQLVGSFGPAMEVFSRYSEVRTDTGASVGVDRALDAASEAVSEFRIQQLSARGLADVEAEGRFYLLCWDVLQAAEFRFNEAHMLGKAVGMDVDTMILAGLISKAGDKVRLLSAKERRRPKRLEPDEVEETLFGAMARKTAKRVRKSDALKIHPNDPRFRTALDACHALALRYAEAGGKRPGIGAAKQLATQQGWKSGSPVARLMEALVRAAPPALQFEKGKTSAAAMYPEFQAWHALLEPLFGIDAPKWVEEVIPSGMPLFEQADSTEDEVDEEEGDDEEA